VGARLGDRFVRIAVKDAETNRRTVGIMRDVLNRRLALG
jgi:histidinol-phosphate/aromatic aminotransferase/cobyric acid decarboxylase-like protein